MEEPGAYKICGMQNGKERRARGPQPNSLQNQPGEGTERKDVRRIAKKLDVKRENGSESAREKNVVYKGEVK